MSRNTAKAAFYCAAALSVHAARAGEVAGVSMPKVDNVAGVELRLNGMGAFKKAIFFKVYVVGLYLEKPTTDARAAITTDEAKRIVIHMLRNVSREMFVQALAMGILRNSGPEMPPFVRDLIFWSRRSRRLRKGTYST